MKKRWIASALLLISPILAQASLTYYLGISGGVNQNAAEIELTNAFSDIASFSAGPNADADTDHLSGIGQIQFGAGFSHKIYYLGVEMIGQLFSGKFDEVHSNYTQSNLSPPPQVITLSDKTRLHLNDFEFAVDLKPGIYIYNKTMLYARLGVGFNEMTLQQTATATNTFNNVAFDANSSETENVYAWRVGLGLERRLAEHFSIAVDYVYSQYDDISTQGNGAFFFPPDTHFTLNAQSEASNLSRQVVTLGVNYYL